MPDRPLTLMTVHAHPDDEVIGTGGTMAKAVKAGHRVVLVTGTRGELGEIVVKDMDTPDNHRRLAELRAAELEAAINTYIKTRNADPKPFRWTKSADDILASIERFCRRTISAHQTAA